MNFAFLILIQFLITIVSGQTTSFDQQQLSSASSKALESDVTIIYNFILDFNSRYDQYISYMGANGMKLPTGLGNYFVGIQTISEEKILFEDIKTRAFPFSDFATMVTQFEWYSSILSEAGATTFYVPNDFLTGQVKETGDVDTVASSTSTISSITTLITSSVSSTGSIANDSSSSTVQSLSTLSQNAAQHQYIPIFSVLLASLFLL